MSRRFTQNSQPEAALNRSIHIEPSEDPEMSTKARRRSHRVRNEADLFGMFPTIALKADGWSAVECFKKTRKSCQEAVSVGGG
mmetsp:Transcript_4603/g.6986  ORF Transcript_4603/g.6986 Transcript_4603/m.6986 type:complete len:83 (+) Transcript_4603:497-745(+)